VPVQPANPAIFTADASGAGQATAQNADGTPNSPSNPAQPGSVITLWATGAGQTDPPGVDGQLSTDPLPRLALPITATVGGKIATVVYAGPAPSIVSGIVQLNILVPADATSGAAVPILVRAGEFSSGPDATVAVALDAR